RHTSARKSSWDHRTERLVSGAASAGTGTPWFFTRIAVLFTTFLLQLRVLLLGFLQNGDVGIGVFPEGKKVLIGGTALVGVAGNGVSASDPRCASSQAHSFVAGHGFPALRGRCVPRCPCSPR